MPSEKLLELLPSLVDRTAYKTRINRAFIEKDFWAITLLKRVLSLHPDLVFKGGTSLSKCHHIINRFSEDIRHIAESIGKRQELYLSAANNLARVLANAGKTSPCRP